MITRRSVLSIFPATVLSSAATASFAQGQEQQSILEAGLLRPETDPDFGPLITGQQNNGGAIVGTSPSRHEEVRTAFRLLLDAPQGAPLISTARYFEKIKAVNQDNEQYNAEWKERANPLIVGMFGVTGTSPASGDQTSWCAAFVSTCLYLSYLPNAYTALSGGYRKFGSDVTGTPQEGDLAVFSKFGADGTKGFGHIGIFLRKEAKDGKEGLVVLGGNQRGGTGTTGAVTETWFPFEGTDLYVHSIRRIPGG